MEHHQLLEIMNSGDIRNIASLYEINKELPRLVYAAEYFQTCYCFAQQQRYHQPRTYAIAETARLFHLREQTIRNYLSINHLINN